MIHERELQHRQVFLESTVGRDYLTKELKDHFHAELIFVSSSLEHIVLSREEASGIVAQYPDFDLIPDDSVTLLQAKGQKIALEYAEDVARRRQPVAPQTIRTIHEMVFCQVAPETAGRYREEHIRLAGSQLMPAIPDYIPMEMRDLGDRLRRDLASSEASVGQVLQAAAWAHYEVTRIHPFRDGNGRVARILFNLICRRYSLPYVLVPKSGTEARLRAGLRAADCGDLSALVSYHGELLAQSYDFVLAYYRSRT